MTRQNFSISVSDLLERFHKHQELYRLAVRRQDVPTANRHILKASEYLNALAALNPAGRETIETLLTHPDAYLRLRAAGSVLSWSPEKAIPVLGRLLFEDLGPTRSPDERLDIRTEAKGWLYKHFGIRSFDRNDLIEPLRAYGVELPYRDHAKWQ
ncbi:MULTISPECIES: hypothetical protein [Chelativorans]|jgi:hypothetical protein|uniref:DUF2019 domain-containing protein n=1 Tax=Chelativorans sp. (strain BNC1) TaxID=266779 RepID=Q11JV0_CHESB|nr:MULTISPECIES: hypothetical protein [Chelativorans]